MMMKRLLGLMVLALASVGAHAQRIPVAVTTVGCSTSACLLAAANTWFGTYYEKTPPGFTAGTYVEPHVANAADTSGTYLIVKSTTYPISLVFYAQSQPRAGTWAVNSYYAVTDAEAYTVDAAYWNNHAHKTADVVNQNLAGQSVNEPQTITNAIYFTSSPPAGQTPPPNPPEAPNLDPEWVVDETTGGGFWARPGDSWTVTTADGYKWTVTFNGYSFVATKVLDPKGQPVSTTGGKIGPNGASATPSQPGGTVSIPTTPYTTPIPLVVPDLPPIPSITVCDPVPVDQGYDNFPCLQGSVVRTITAFPY